MGYLEFYRWFYWNCLGQDLLGLDPLLYINMNDKEVNNLILYTTPTCTRCKVLKMKLGIKNISYEEIDDEKILQEKGIIFAPALEVNGDLFNFEQANNYINSL